MEHDIPDISNVQGRTAIAIMTYNRSSVLATLLGSVHEEGLYDRCPVAIFEDGGFTDDTAGFLLGMKDVGPGTVHPELDAVRYGGQHADIFLGRHNLGVAANSNRAIRWFMEMTDADHLMLFNDDVRVIGPCDNAYRRAHHDTGIGLFCFHDFEGPEYAGFIANYAGWPVRVYPRMTGMMMSMTRKLIEYVGYFDTSMGLFGEEHSGPKNSPIWMGDYSQKPIDQVKVGDSVIGWTRREKKIYREDAKNPCHQKWSNPNAKKNAPHNTLCRSTVIGVKSYISDCVVRVTMKSGRTFECTADHQWWNYNFKDGTILTKGRKGRAGQRNVPYVNPVAGSKLVHVTESLYRLPDTADYKRGYIQGAMDGDGCYTKACKLDAIKGPFTDTFERYAREFFKITARPYYYYVHDGSTRPCRRIYIRGGNKTARKFQAWKPTNDEQWRGWLAGMYDAEGSGHAIAQTKAVNPEIYSMICEGLKRFKFKITPQKNQVNIRGGRGEMLRFFNLVGPACGYKLDAVVLTGRFRKKDHVVNVEKLPNETVYCLMTSTGNYIMHGYASKNCDFTNRARLAGFIAMDKQAQQCVDAVTGTLRSQHGHPSSVLGEARAVADQMAARGIQEAGMRYKTESLFRGYSLRYPRIASGREGSGIPLQCLTPGYIFVDDPEPSNFLCG